MENSETRELLDFLTIFEAIIFHGFKTNCLSKVLLNPLDIVYLKPWCHFGSGKPIFGLLLDKLAQKTLQ
jgi:hypothetical protein